MCTLQRTHFNTLQHTATHCDTTAHYNTLVNLFYFESYLLRISKSKQKICFVKYKQTSTHYSTLQLIATQQHTATHCNTTTHCNTLLYFAYFKLGTLRILKRKQKIHFAKNTLQHTATHCNATTHCITL